LADKAIRNILPFMRNGGYSSYCPIWAFGIASKLSRNDKRRLARAAFIFRHKK
jgi:hypothetical protein